MFNNEEIQELVYELYEDYQKYLIEHHAVDLNFEAIKLKVSKEWIILAEEAPDNSNKQLVSMFSKHKNFIIIPYHH